MSSPFPGMDPFLESQAWRDFHHHVIVRAATTLVRSVRPRYVVEIEKHVYLEHQPEEPPSWLLRNRGVSGRGTPGTSTPVEERRAYLTLRDRRGSELVTVIEVVSPPNKRLNSDGRREYLKKRETVLRSRAHLVELDLLRGGERLPTVEPLPAGDYFVFVSRARRRPGVTVYPWALRQALPTLPIPLAGSDPDVQLDLQAVFTTTYDEAGYDYSLDYTRPVEPPLSDEDAAWVREALAAMPAGAE